MTKDFKHNLTTLIKTIDSTFKNINNGGCGHFALMLGRKLEELGHDVKGVCLQTILNLDDLEEIKELYKMPSKELSQLNERGGYIHHLMLNVDGYIIDSTGVYDNLDVVKSKQYPQFDKVGTIDLEILEGWCKSERWNPTFDVEQLPRMNHIIGKYIGQELTIMKRLELLFAD